MSNTIRHVGIVVRDIDASIKFWSETMNFKIDKIANETGKKLDKMIGLENVEVKTVKLKDENDNTLELLKFFSHEMDSIWSGKQYSLGITHIALNVKNIENISKKLENIYGSIGSEVQLSYDGSVKMTYAKGPEGLLLELVEEVKNDKQ